MKDSNKGAAQMLANRRSVKAAELRDPAPNSVDIQEIISIASRVPDHGKRVPFRFILCDTSAQAELGEVFARAFKQANPEDAQQKHLEHERERPCRAPLLIILVHVPQMGKIPVWEQRLTTGAVGMNLLNALHAYGYAGQWLTEWPTYDTQVHKALKLKDEERIAGFFYIGTADTPPELREDRARPDTDSVALSWQAWQAGRSE